MDIQSYQKKTLYIILWFTLAGTLILGVTNFLLTAHLVALSLLASSAVCAFCLVLLRRGHYRAPVILLSVVVYFAATFNIVDSGGMHDSGALAFPVMVVLFSYLLGKKSVYLFGSLSVLLMILIRVAEVNGWFQVTPYVPQYTAIITYVILMGATAVLVWISLRNQEKSFGHIEQANRDLEELNRRLSETNEKLQDLVQEKIREVRDKDHILITQSRQAAMGEMIHNIAHQWRQPLNALGITAQNIKLYYDMNKLDADYVGQLETTILRLVQHMSQTIDDFRNFFKPDREKTPFSLKDSVQSAVNLVNDAFRNQSIRIECDNCSDIYILGYPNEFRQVVLNLLNNARDAVMAKGKEGGLVSIRTFQDEGRAVLTISDNGGGIPDDLIPKIGTPYFTTKTDGTGIGLYMSKMIAEKNMDGRLTFKNTGLGAEFRIELPIIPKPDEDSQPA